MVFGLAQRTTKNSVFLLKKKGIRKQSVILAEDWKNGLGKITACMMLDFFFFFFWGGRREIETEAER